MTRPAHHRHKIEAARLRDATAELVCEARAKGMLITDMCVRGRDAASLIGLSHFTLRNWRSGKDPLEHRKPKGRHLYPLIALARYRLETNDRARQDAAEMYRNALDSADAPAEHPPMFPKQRACR